MRTYLIAVVMAGVLGSSAAYAEDRLEVAAKSASLFSEDGVLIAPGESREITIAGDCRVLTNKDATVGFYITPALYDAWPDESDRAPFEPVVTEAPCQ